MRKSAFSVFLVILFCMLAVPAGATEGSEYAFEAATETECKQILAAFRPIKLDKEPKKDHLTTFAVARDGRYAVGYENDEEKTVLVYSSDYVFLYGWKLHDPGSFRLDWIDSNLFAVSVRSEMFISLSANNAGEYVLTLPIHKETKGYWNYLASTEKTQGETTWFLDDESDSIMTNSYSMLCKTVNGNTTTVYRAETNISDSPAGFLILWVTILTVIVVSLLVRKQQIRSNNE